MAFVRQSIFTCMIIESVIKNSAGSDITKMWPDFYMVSTLPNLFRISFRFGHYIKSKLSKSEQNS